MDEMQMIKDAYGRPAPPTMRETEQARARMFEDGTGKGRTGRRSGFGWRLKGGLGLVAAGAAAAVAIAAIGSGGAPPEGGGVAGGGPAGEVNLDRQAVLVAAENAAKQPMGEYFFADHVSGQSYVVPTETGSFALVGRRSETFVAGGVRPGMPVKYYGREPAPRLWTDADKAAWKRAGSPRKVKVFSGDKWLVFDMARKSRWEPSGSTTAGEPGWLDDWTIEELQNLPTDPETLAKKFLDPKDMLPALGMGDPKGKKSAPDIPDRFKTERFKAGWKIRQVGWRLGDLPLPPKVRAGLIRALVAQPGVKAVGETTDPLGRKGVAVTAGAEKTEAKAEYGRPAEQVGTYSSRHELVFDKETGKVLAMQYVLVEPGGPYKDQEPGFIINYTAVRDMGFTDTMPKPSE